LFLGRTSATAGAAAALMAFDVSRRLTGTRSPPLGQGVDGGV
jgi:hypothetical protein